MKLIDYAEELLEDSSVEGVKRIKKVINYLDGNCTLLPSTIVPFDAEEARSVREYLIGKIYGRK